MKWIKKGLIFQPDGRFEWSKHYAQVPTPLELDHCIRIFYTTRPDVKDGNHVSYCSFIDVEKDKPQNIIYIHNKPVLDLGEKGTFDEFGIMPGSFIKKDNLLYLYYTGWSREIGVPYTTSIGLAISRDNGNSFNRISLGPLLSKNITDPFLINGPYVIEIIDKFHMWYSSCYKWVNNEDRLDPIYKIKHAVSDNGINWIPDDYFCISEKIENEAQNAPCIKFINGFYYMFFCYRKGTNFRNSQNGYKLSCAISKDINNWKRIDDGIFNVNDNISWDSEMKAYPRVIQINDRILFFYNGNYFGKDGFGYAELEF